MVDQKRSYAAAADPVPSLLSILNLMLRRRRLVVGLGLLGFVLAAGTTVLHEREYESTSRFLPQFSTGSSEVRPMGGGEGALVMLQFYSSLLRTHEILREAATRRYTFPVNETGDSLSGTIAELYEIEGPPEAQIATSIGILRENVQSGPDPRTATVVLTTRARWRGLAAAINQTLLDLMNEFNIEKRQTQAANERQFIERLRDDTYQELLTAEARMQEFLQRNRLWENSPQLVFEHRRLERQVDLQRRLHASLSDQYNLAQIAEVRDTPVLTLVEAPTIESVEPARGRSPVFLGILGGFGGTLLGTLWAFGGAYLKSQSAENRAEYEELLKLSRQTWRDIKPTRWVRRPGTHAEKAKMDSPAHDLANR